MLMSRDFAVPEKIAAHGIKYAKACEAGALIGLGALNRRLKERVDTWDDFRNMPTAIELTHQIAQDLQELQEQISAS